MNPLPIRPIAMTEETVTLTRGDFDALADLVRDAKDLADADAVMRRLSAGETEAFPISVADRLLDGGNPVTVFREHRGLSGRELATRAGISASYLSEIEGGRKPGSLEVMVSLAGVLDVSLDLLVPIAGTSGGAHPATDTMIQD